MGSKVVPLKHIKLNKKGDDDKSESDSEETSDGTMRSKNDEEDIIDDKADVVEVDLRGTKDGRNIDDLLDNKTNDNKKNAMCEFHTDKCVLEVHTGVNKRKLVQNDPAKKLVTPTGTGTISDSSSGHSETPKKNLFSSKKRRKLL